MNRIYRTIWNEKTGTFVAVSENIKAAGRKSSPRTGTVARGARFALKALAGWMMLAFSSSLYANPTGGTVAAGSATISGGAGGMTITQASQNAAINWQSFSIGSGESVQFVQPNAASVALNRVLGPDPSSILGSLSANGKVFLVNPNGILFGRGASVNVGGLVASTLGISDSDFMAGRYQFAGTSNAKVENQGTINAAGGYVALLGANVSNEGVITARLGMVALAAGKAVTLDVAGDGLLNVAVDQGAVNALVQNGGLIQADGGQVLLTAQSAGQLLATVVNNTGVIQAQTVENKNGVVKLLGDMQSGTVNVGGTLDASAPNGGNGGFIETSAAHVKLASDAKVTTAAAQGLTGSWLIDPQDYTIAASGGDITGATLSSNLASTNVTIESSSGGTAGSGDINVNDAVSWSANTLTLTAARDININAVMTASGTSALVMNTVTANGADAAVAGGTVKVGLNDSGFTGRVDFPGRSGTGFLTINGTGYTVINALGAEGSTTGADLQGISGSLAGNYALGDNIDASATSGWNAGAGFAPVGNFGTPFSGTFNGLGHTVSNLTINLPTTNYVGMFGAIDSTGAARNVGLVGGSVTGNSYVGGLAGWHYGSIADSFATVSVKGIDIVGGLAGANYGSISNGRFEGAVVGTNSRVGGLVGGNYGSISNSFATGSVVAIDASGMMVGGLVGNNTGGGSISNSFATNSVTGNEWVGGLVGTNLGNIADSYATGAVIGSSYVGGLAGINVNGGNISNSYATGSVNGPNNYVGGLVGENGSGGSVSNSYATGAVTGLGSVGGLAGRNNGAIDNSYSTGAVSGSLNVGGLVGSNSSGTVTNSFWNIDTAGVADNGIGRGLTTVDMQTQANFTSATAANGNVNPGWDFTNTWVMYEGHTAPLLRSFMTPLTVTANSATKTYDGLAYNGSAGVAYSTAPDVSKLLGTVSYTSGVNAGSYAITAAGLYSNQQGYLITYVDGTLTVTPKALTVTGMTASNKVYDGATTATLSGGTLNGLVAGETLGFSGQSGAFADKNVGTGKSVTVSGITLSDGTGLASNYSVSNPTGLTADITPRSLTVTGMTASNKVYDGTMTATLSGGTLSGLVAGETLGFSGQSGAFADKNAGTGKTVTVSGITLSDGTGLASNYSVSNPTGLTANITARSLTVSASGVDKVYDGTTVASVTLGDNRVAGDSLTLSDTAANFSNKNVGTGKTVNVSGISISGADAGNYTLSSTTAGTTANITARTLTVTATGTSRVYDGTTAASVTLGDNRVAGDVLTLSNATANFADKNVGTAKTVNVSGIAASGTDAGNYTLAGTTASTTADITPRSLTVTGMTASNKVYDGATTAALSGGTLNGLVAGETLGFSGQSGAFGDKNVGTGKTVTVSGITLSDGTGLASNYSVSNPTGLTANITARSLTVSASGVNKVYDGTTAASVTLGDNRVAGDALNLSYTASFADPDIGTGKTVSVTGIGVAGIDAGNYTLANTTASTTADITSVPIVKVPTNIQDAIAVTLSLTSSKPSPAPQAGVPEPAGQSELGSVVRDLKLTVIGRGVNLPLDVR